MTQASAVIPSLDGYQLRLPAFEGPLDVLLRLIERDQLAISEISLLAVFDQFMAYVGALDSPAPVVIAEFAAVAGRLSLLKSRALLPKPAKLSEELDEHDLVRQLEEYRAVKAAAELLAGRQRDGSGAFGRGEAITRPPLEPARFAPQPPSALAKAVSRWLTRLPPNPQIFSPFRVVSLREMIARIALLLDREGGTSFERIRATCSDRHETAVAFLALLTLMRRQVVVAAQSELFGAIALSRPVARPGARPEVVLTLNARDANGHE